MNTKFFILYFILFSNILSIKILQKYSSVKVRCTDEKSIAFDSSGFNLNEDMFFTFSGKTLEKTIYYKFEDNVYDGTSYDINSANGKSKEPTSTYQTKSGKKVTSIKKYYSINKEEDKHYTLIGFYCKEGTLTIENTKENAGKKSNTIIIIVVVVCGVVAIGIIIFSCIRAKKARAAKAAMRMQMASGGYYPQPGMNMGMSVGVGMPPAYGNNCMMNNMPPQPGLISSNPVAYSRMPNDATQIEPNSPNELPPVSSGKRKIKSKV